MASTSTPTAAGRSTTRSSVPADLIITMTREHVREVAVSDVAFLEKTFTLKELVALGDAVGPRRSTEPLESWLARLGADRKRSALLGVGHDPAFDVEDPIGGTTAQYRATAAELDGLLGRMVALLWPEPGPAPRRRTGPQGRSA